MSRRRSWQPAVPAKQPSILYLDSLGGEKQKAFNLLKTYLDLEWKDKEAAREKEAKARVGAPPAAAEPPSVSAAPPASSQSSDLCEIVSSSMAYSTPAGTSSIDLTAESPGAYEGLFDAMPHHNIAVPHQQNSVDCGLYMLRFIERVAQCNPDLPSAKRKRWDSALAEDGLELGEGGLGPHEITAWRFEMADAIEVLGKRQRAEKEEAAAREEGQPKKHKARGERIGHCSAQHVYSGACKAHESGEARPAGSCSIRAWRRVWLPRRQFTAILSTVRGRVCTVQ